MSASAHHPGFSDTDHTAPGQNGRIQTDRRRRRGPRRQAEADIKELTQSAAVTSDSAAFGEGEHPSRLKATVVAANGGNCENNGTSQDQCVFALAVKKALPGSDMNTVDKSLERIVVGPIAALSRVVRQHCPQLDYSVVERLVIRPAAMAATLRGIGKPGGLV